MYLGHVAAEHVARKERQKRQQRIAEKRGRESDERQRNQRFVASDVHEAAFEIVAHPGSRVHRHMAGMEREDREDDGEKREAVEAETRHHAERGERSAGEQRADHARDVELNRVQRDGIRQVVLLDEQWHQRLIRGTAERLGAAGDGGEDQYLPDPDEVEIHEHREHERGAHLDDLRRDEKPAAIVAVGHDAADQREEQDGQLAEKRIQPEIERR